MLRLENAKIEDVSDEIRSLVEKWAKMDLALDGGHKTSIFLHGNFASGKTHAAYAIKNYLSKSDSLFKNPDNLKLVNFTDMMLNSSFRDDESNEDNVNINKLAWLQGLLIIDDLAAKTPTSRDEDILYMIINRRYEKGYPTLITSNLSPEDIEKVYGTRIASRIQRSYVIIKMG